jgi:hypothetical protein
MLSVVITISLPIAVAFLKQRINVANAADQHAMIDRAVRHGALLSYGEQVAGQDPGVAATKGLDYAKSAASGPINAINASDSHLTSAIAAEVVSLNRTAPTAAVAPAPSAVITELSHQQHTASIVRILIPPSKP